MTTYVVTAESAKRALEHLNRSNTPGREREAYDMLEAAQQAPGAQVAGEGYELASVKGLGGLVLALEEAERNGALPFDVESAWEDFAQDYSYVATPPAAPAAPAEHARQALEEYGRKMYDAGMDAASDFRDRQRDGLTKERDAAEMLDAFLASQTTAPALSEPHHNFTTHRRPWREAIETLAKQDDSGYWSHELRAFDDAYAGRNDDSAPAAPALSERDVLRAEQSANVMPLIGPLLDAWDGLNNDTKGVLREEGPDLAKHLASINHAMEATAPNQTPAPAAQELSDADIDAVTQKWAGSVDVPQSRLKMCREYARAILAASRTTPTPGKATP